MAEQAKVHRFRDRACEHHAAAGRLLATKLAADAVYACLELRMALECLTYDLLKLYGDDVTDEILSKWQAGKILDALVEVDPEIGSAIEITIAGEDGTFDQPLGRLREERMRVKWAKKTYHQLGNFLHERTFEQVGRGIQADHEKVSERATAIYEEIGRVLDSSSWNFRLSVRFGMHCDCGDIAHLHMTPSQLKSIARCPACGSIYEVLRKAGSDNSIQSRKISKRDEAT